MNAIKEIKQTWVVQIQFSNGENAMECKKHLDKIKERGGSPLHNALFASDIAHAEAIEITREKV